MVGSERLRDILQARIDAFSRGGARAWSALEEPETASVDFAGTPLILLGAGSQIAQPLVAACIERHTVLALVDNGCAGRTIGGQVVQGDGDLAGIVHRNPDAILINCCGGVSGMAHFNRVAAGFDRYPLHLFQAMRRVGLTDSVPRRIWIEYADPALHVDLIRARDLGPVFEGELSRQTYYALQLFRLSWCADWLEPIRQPHEAEYFGTDVVKLHDAEVFVDGGAYTGDSIHSFLAASGGRFVQIHAFEPDEANFAALAQAHGSGERITLRQAGLWRSSGRLGFSHGGDSGSHMSKDAADEIEVLALDDLDLAPTFIKLDIEGAEMDVLEGAVTTLRRYRPRLAVCVYHRVSHLWDTVAFLEGLGLGYRFALRHTDKFLYGSVLYAW